MSEVKVNKISPRTNCGTVTLGDSGDSFTIPSGVTITNNGTQTGFGRTGTVDWVTTVQTSGFTAANGKGYFVNTTSGAISVNLPAGSAGDIVAFKDYAGTWDTNAITIVPNGSDKIASIADSTTLNTERQSITLIFIDSTQGWLDIHDSTSSVTGSQFISATGGTVTTVCTNFKVHTFTGPGTFCISSGSGPKARADYLVIAGGGGGVHDRSGGGGAGGYREVKTGCNGCYTASPLAASSGPGVLQLCGPVAIPITVGAGGAGDNSPPHCAGNSGSNSVFSTITSAGGGAGNRNNPNNGGDGGAGGGGGFAGSAGSGGSGNTPPVSPPQGNDGGDAAGSPSRSGGGGGAGAAGGPAASGKAGGAGVTSSINGTPTQRAGGGGGIASGAAGAGGGGAGGADCSGSGGADGTANTGGGAGGGGSNTDGGSGGSGVVIIRYKFQ